MATTPYFHWPPHSTADSDFAGFGSGAPEIALTATDTTALVSPDQQQRAVVARPRMRRNSSGPGKQQSQQQQKAGGGGAKKPPQRGLGVAELERLRCGGDPLREIAGMVDAGAQVHPLMQCNHHHHHAPASSSAFDARYCPSLLVPPPPAPAGPGCYVHHPAVPGCHQRTPPALAPEQQYFMNRWGRMGPGFSPPAGKGACADHQAHSLAPEHPSSQNAIWRPAASSSSCLQSGHRCDLCSRKMVRAFAERGAPLPSALPPSPPSTVPDYSIYDLAAAMATVRQGEAAFVVRDRKRGGALTGEVPAKKEVREIEFFPAASTHHAGGGGTGLDVSEFVAPVSSSYGAGGCAAPPPLDLSLRL